MADDSGRVTGQCSASLLQAYMGAHYRCHVGGRDVPLRVGERARALEAALPQASGFAFITAHNPMSRPQSAARNATAAAALAQALLAADVTHLPADAADAKGHWRESGHLLLDIGPVLLDHLARRFGQLGTLHWRRGQPVGLRMQGCAPAGAPVACWLHWLESASPSDPPRP